MTHAAHRAVPADRRAGEDLFAEAGVAHAAEAKNRTWRSRPRGARMRHHRITRSMALGLALAALAAPTAAGQQQDLRSQDALDAARSLPPNQLAAVSQGLRSSTRQDLRSQDALDAARSLPPNQLAAVSQGLRSSTRQDLRSPDGFDWPSAAIGAASMLVLMGASRAGVLRIRQIRRRAAQA
jgi:hypothetical protein